MTSRSQRFVHAGLNTLILLLVILFPAPGRSQTQENVPPASAATGTSPAPQTTPRQAPAAIAPESSATAAEQPGTYTVKGGDTLWDIANAHYRDPFLWPLIWKSNPFIEDPDLIYPGASLVIPSLAPVERAMTEPQEAEKRLQEQPAPTPAPPGETESQALFQRKPSGEAQQAEQAAPTSRLVVPQETVQPIFDKYAMIRAGFVADEPSSDKIVESVMDPDKKLISYDDEVYISVRSRQDVKVGDRFLIYRPDHNVKHPVTKRSYGPLNIVIGILTVTAARENGIHTARFLATFDDAGQGDLLTPYQEPELLYPSKEKKAKDVSGYLLEVRDYRRINGQVDVVYLDKGKADGVDPGDVYTIFSNHGRTDVAHTIGEVQVLLVKERTSTAVIRKSSDAVGRGDRFQYKN